MIKVIAILLLLLMGAVALTYLIHHVPGHVQIAYGHTSIEINLWAASLSIVILFLLFYGLLRLLALPMRLKEKFQKWQQQHQVHKLRDYAKELPIFFIKNDWKGVEKTSLKIVDHDPELHSAYFTAAYAAAKRNDFTQTNLYLDQVLLKDKALKLDVQLFRAQLLIDQKRFSEAEFILEDINQTHPSNPKALDLLQLCYRELNHWEKLHQLWPSVKKYSTLSNEELSPVEIEMYQVLIEQHKITAQDLPRSIRDKFQPQVH